MRDIVSENILDFLKILKINNNRDWFNAHKQEFESAKAALKMVSNTVLETLKTHDEIERLKLFRVHRDLRFSKDKTPYKTHFGIVFQREKPRLRGGYYIHIEPGDASFIASGFWEPNKEDLLRIRKEFETDDITFRAIINDPVFKNIWGNLVGNEVKTAPKGFRKEHKAIGLIRKKQYIFVKKFTDKAVLSTHFINDVETAFKAIRPYLDYMSDVLTTDLNGESAI